jgi:tetratricopeptide (TPR) repeat protein
MSVNTHISPASPNPAIRNRCLWLKFKAKTLLVVGLRAQAHDVFQEILTINPADPLALNSLGYQELSNQRFIQALGYFERALLQTPNNANAHFNVGFVCEELGRTQQAELAFNAALQIDEKLDRAWYGLGLALVRQQRFEESLAAFKRNTELQSMSPFAWYQMARVHMELGQPEEALAVMRHLKGFEPKVAAQLERETGLKLGGPA